MTRTPGLHDPNVPTDEYAERVDTDAPIVIRKGEWICAGCASGGDDSE